MTVIFKCDNIINRLLNQSGFVAVNTGGLNLARLNSLTYRFLLIHRDSIVIQTWCMFGAALNSRAYGKVNSQVNSEVNSEVTITFRMHAGLLGSLLLLLSVSSEARITNAQSRLLDIREDGLSLNSEIAYSWVAGSSEIMQFSFGGGPHWLREPHLFFLSVSGAYAQKDSERFVNRYYGHLRYRYRIWKPMMAEAFVQGEYNEFRRILTRLPVGAGPRIEHAVGDEALFLMALGSSYMFEMVYLSEDFNEAGVRYGDSHNHEYNHRWNNYVALKLKLPVFSVGSTIYMQPRFNDFADYLLLWQSDVTFKITDGFSISIDYSLFRDSRPPVSVVKQDTELKTVLNVTLGPWFAKQDGLDERH